MNDTADLLVDPAAIVPDLHPKPVRVGPSGDPDQAAPLDIGKSVEDGVFHKGLDEQTAAGPLAVFLREIDLIFKALHQSEFLQAQILLHPAEFLAQGHVFSLFGEGVAKNVRQVAKHFRHLKIPRLQNVIVDGVQGVADKVGVDLAFQGLALGLVALLDGEGLFLEIPLNLLPLLMQSVHHVVVLLRQLPQLVGALHRDLPVLISPLDLLHGIADGLDGPQDPAHHPLPNQAAGGQQEDVDADGPVIQPVHIAAQIAGVDADMGGPAEIGQGFFQLHGGAAGLVF